MIFKSLLLISFFPFAAASAAQASVRCEDVFAPAAAAAFAPPKDNGFMMDLVRLSLRLESMPEGQEKYLLTEELKEKFQQALTELGPSFREEFLVLRASVAANHQKDARDQQDARAQNLTKAQEIARRWSRVDEIGDLQAPRNRFAAAFYDEHTIVFTKKNKIVFHDLETNREVRALDVKGVLFTKPIQISADRKFIFIANPVLMKIEIDNPANVVTVKDALTGEQNTPVHLKLSPDGSLIAISGHGGQSAFYQTADLTKTGGWKKPNTDLSSPAIVQDLKFSSDGRSALVHRSEDYSMLFDVATGEPVAKVQALRKKQKAAREGHWRQARFIPGRDALFVLNQFGHMRLWDFTAKKVLEFNTRESFDDAFVTADGRNVVVIKKSGFTDEGPVLAVYDLATGEPNPSFQLPEGWGRARFLAYNADGTKLALRESENENGESNRIAILDLATLEMTVARLHLPAGRDLPQGPALLNAEGTRLLVADFEGQFLISIH